MERTRVHGKVRNLRLRDALGENAPSPRLKRSQWKTERDTGVLLRTGQIILFQRQARMLKCSLDGTWSLILMIQVLNSTESLSMVCSLSKTIAQTMIPFI